MTGYEWMALGYGCPVPGGASACSIHRYCPLPDPQLDTPRQRLIGHGLDGELEVIPNYTIRISMSASSQRRTSHRVPLEPSCSEIHQNFRGH